MLQSSVKGKVFPLRSTEVNLGERRYSLYSFLTLALEGGQSSVYSAKQFCPQCKKKNAFPHSRTVPLFKMKRLKQYIAIMFSERVVEWQNLVVFL
jgi:hypothetical protein